MVSPINHWVNAALFYFALVFGTGFLLGVVRTLWVVPLVGVRTAELLEIPLMMAVSAAACGSALRRFTVPGAASYRIGMGLLGLSLLIAAELGLNALLVGRPFAEFFTSRDTVSGSVYFLALALFALMPLLMRRSGPPNEISMIDAFMDRSDVEETHETVVQAPADLVFDVAEHFDLQSIPAIKAIFWLRERVFRLESKPRIPRGIVAGTMSLGWGQLAHRPGREIVMGAVTQPWIGDVKFKSIPPLAFRGFSEPDFVKIAWTLEAEPIDDKRTLFRTQTRALATDRHARIRFRIYWLFAGFFIVLIRRIANRAIRREAERRFRDGEAGLIAATGNRAH
jgi:hypothetical protein